MRADRTVVGDRAAARVRAFEIVQEVQSLEPGAGERLAELFESAVASGWPEVARIVLFGQAVASWISRGERLGADVDTLIECSRRDHDHCMLAVGLAMRAAFVAEGGLGAGSPAFDSDLAEAVVLLESAEAGPLEMITARTACGIAFDYRSLWELGDEQYAAAQAFQALAGPGVGQTMLAAVMFNRAEAHVSWASRLRQLGDHAALAERWRAWDEVAARSESYGLPPTWKTELTALGLLMEAMAGYDVAIASVRLLGQLEEGGSADPRPVAHLKLALALSRFGSVGSEARPEVSDALEAVDGEVFPLMYELALFLAAEVEAADGRDIGLRCARLHIERRWADRLTQLESMQARIASQRMRTELDRVSLEARRDDLTGIGNRRALASYTAEVQRLGTETLAVIMVDVDNFKSVNDKFGHDVGDAVLARIAGILDLGVRPGDLAIRFGGDEFLVMLANVETEVADQRARLLMKQIDEQAWEDLAAGLRIEVSMGVAAGRLADLGAVRAQADRAVYQAKNRGGGVVAVG
jgi:diguanylate cyclase (GGDEF)-like protein